MVVTLIYQTYLIAYNTKSLTITSTTDAVTARDSYFQLPAVPVKRDVNQTKYIPINYLYNNLFVLEGWCTSVQISQLYLKWYICT